MARSSGKTASMDIPGPARRSQAAMLPTPPSSISPCLNPQGFKHRAAQEAAVALHQYNLRSPPASATLAPHADYDIDAVDSDIDLQDTVDRRTPRTKSGKADVAGDITPAMLARHHLPDILLAHGPLAIRHIMGYLTTSVPGFAIIPPAKARRLVVAGLEGKSDADVEFEKVGWGRWDAYRRGQRDVPRVGRAVVDHDVHPHYGSSVTAESTAFSHAGFGRERGHSGDLDMDIDDVDKMSLDGGDDSSRMYCSSSDAEEPDVMDGDWDEADLTDEEDWANIGADALRAQSLGQEASMPSSVYVRGPFGQGGGPSSFALAKAAPMPMPGVSGDIEERAAVEALLQLGSM